MTRLWNKKDIPHKGWVLFDVIDLREDGSSVEETDYENCMMCGKQGIRYVHIVEHRDVEQQFRVGCVCSEKMTNDYINPKEKEKKLRNRSNRRINWLRRKWQISGKGNLYLNIDGNNIGIFEVSEGHFKCRINDTFGSVLYNDLTSAKIGLFRKIEDLKNKNQW